MSETPQRMKMWLLRPIEGLRDDPWSPWYDKAFGFVVCADSEEAARQIAHNEGGDETRENPAAWLNPAFSTCIELTPDRPAGVVMRDLASA